MRSENRAPTYTIKNSINLIKKVTPPLKVAQREKSKKEIMCTKTWPCNLQENVGR